MWLFTHRSFIRGTVLAGLTLTSCHAAAQEKLSVPVQLLSLPRAQATAVTEPPQVTPAARMPQYQLHRTDAGTVVNPESPSIRFLLATPEQLLLVEAMVTIDGQPFSQPREQRIQKIMSFINDPEAFRNAEAKALPAAASAPGIQTPVDAPSVTPPEPLPKPVEAEASSTETPAAIKEESPADDSTKETPEEPVVEAVPKYQSPATIYDRIERSMKATGTKPSAQEIRWMLANLIDGPVLLYLNDNFQRIRAEQQPLFSVLDLNRDKVVSADEVASAVKSLEACDLDRNDVVESTEIAKIANDPRNWGVETRASHPLVLRLDHATHFSNLIPRLCGLYGEGQSTDAIQAVDSNQNGKLDDDERQSLIERPADLVLGLDLNTQDPTLSRFSVVSGSDQLKPVIETAVCSTNSILLTFSQCALELSSVQGAEPDQISIGAVNDGYAMLPELDPNGDGRFTIRERRTLVDRLKPFDRDGDSSIAANEMFPTYRLCLGLGPHIHEPLSVLRRSSSQAFPAAPAPDWFTEMDKNKDLDLSRTEFPGTDEQFLKLDLDTDQLISIPEASQTSS